MHHAQHGMLCQAHYQNLHIVGRQHRALGTPAALHNRLPEYFLSSHDVQVITRILCTMPKCCHIPGMHFAGLLVSIGSLLVLSLKFWQTRCHKKAIVEFCCSKPTPHLIAQQICTCTLPLCTFGTGWWAESAVADIECAVIGWSFGVEYASRMVALRVYLGFFKSEVLYRRGWMDRTGGVAGGRVRWAYHCAGCE